MIHYRGPNNKINHIHDRALHIVYDDLLNKDKSVTIQQRNLQQLAIEIFKVKIGIAPMIMNEISTFAKNNTYNLRRDMHLSSTESIGNIGAKIWNLVPVHMKDLKALSTFKKRIPKDWPCRLCKVYAAQVGFW